MNRVSGVFLNILLAAILSFSFVPAFAQARYTVKMILKDAKTEEPVGFATVSLSDPKTQKVYKYVLSNSEGTAEFKDVSKGSYLLKVELMGYKTHTSTLEVTKNTDMGLLKIDQDVEVLEAANVSAVGNPIVVKKDTIEYNASSFKTSDNDMLENLLKKLPGIEVSTDGTITANGETINKITIDGKTFFLDDPQLATKNIPAKIINKVKVVEKKSDQAEFTGIDDGEEETVIDLSIRPGMLNGWFGNVMAGGGHDVPDKGYYTSENTALENGWRYQGAGMIGRFTEDSQISVILNGNNTNNRGFNDLAGSMMQTMRGGRGMGGGTGGWGGGNGITTSWMGGANGAFNLFDGDMELSGNYLYNGSNRNVEEESSKTTYKEDGSMLFYDNEGYSITKSEGHRFGIRLEHDFSENTSILFEPRVNFGGGRYTEYSDFTTLSGDETQRDTSNVGFNDNTGFNNNWSTSGFLLFRQRLGKPGRTISANIRYSFSNNVLDGFNQSLTSNYVDGGIDNEIVNQRIAQNSSSSSLSGRIVYTEPLGQDLYLEGNYEYSWNRSKSVKDAFNSASNTTYQDDLGHSHLQYNAEGEVKDLTYSNDILNRYVNQRAGLNFMYQKEKIRAQLGASMNPTNTHNVTNDETYDSKVINWSPQAMLSYDINDNTMVRMFYFGRSSQPSTSQLMPVPDNSDPLNVSLGNPYLLPYFSHSIRTRFGYTNKKTFTSIHANINGSLVQDRIIYARWYDTNGAQYSIPVNGPGSGSVDGRLMVNTPFGKSNFSIFSMSNIRYSESSTFIGTNNLVTDKYYNAEAAEFDYDLFHEDFQKNDELDLFTKNLTQTINFTQRLRFTYRTDFIEVNLGGRTRIAKSWYTVNTGNQNATWNNQLDASVNWTIPGGINLISELNYNWYRGYTTPQEDEFICNAEINKLLFKKKFTLALKAYDILNQAKNLSVTDDSNYHQEVRNNTLGRYIILSLTYRFGNFQNMGGGPRGGHGGPPPRR